MMSYRIKKFALIGAIILVLCLLVGLLVWTSLNNDVANAAFDNSSDLGSIAFPYTSYNTSLISNNFVGSDYTYSSNSASVSIPTSSTTLPNGNIWFASASEVNPTFSFTNYTYMNYDYCGFYTTKMFDYSTSWINLYFKNLSLTAGQPYTFSFILHDVVNSISDINQPYLNCYYRNYSSISTSTRFGSIFVSDIYNNLHNGYCLWSYTFTPTSNRDCIQLILYVGGTYNFYLTKGEHPIYYDYTSNYNLGSIELTSSSPTTNTSFGILFKNGLGAENVNGGSINSVNFSNFTNLSYSYIMSCMKLSTYSLSIVTTLKVSSLYIPISLSFDSLSDSASLYGNWLRFSGVGYISSSSSITASLYVYSSNYWELNLVSSSSGLTYSNIYINFYQNVSTGLISATDYQLGYETAKNDLQTDINNARALGYQEGLETADNGSFIGLMSAVIESPLNAVLSIFDVEILGYNMKSLYMSLLSIALILFVIKFILGHIGGSSD